MTTKILLSIHIFVYTRLKCSIHCLDGKTCNVSPFTWLGLPDPDKKTAKAAWVPRFEMKLKFIHGFTQSPLQLILQLYIFCQGFWYPLLKNLERNNFFWAPAYSFTIFIFILNIGFNFYSICLSSIDYFYQDNDRIISEAICEVSKYTIFYLHSMINSSS